MTNEVGEAESGHPEFGSLSRFWKETVLSRPWLARFYFLAFAAALLFSPWIVWLWWEGELRPIPYLAPDAKYVLLHSTLCCLLAFASVLPRIFWRDTYLLRRIGFFILTGVLLNILEYDGVFDPPVFIRGFIGFGLVGAFIVPSLILSKGGTKAEVVGLSVAYYALIFAIGLAALLSASPLSVAAVFATGPLVFGSPVVLITYVSADYASRRGRV